MRSIGKVAWVVGLLASRTGAREKRMHLFVAGLREVLVELANTPKPIGSKQSHRFVGDPFDFAESIRRTNRDGGNDSGRRFFAQRCNGDQHACSRRQTVIDQNHDAPAYIKRRPISAVIMLTALQLLGLLRGDLGHHGRRIGQDAQHVFVQDADTSRSDGAHRELPVSWHPEFSNNKNIERQAQANRDFVGNRNTAARQRQHDGVRMPLVGAEFIGQQPARFRSITKRSSHLIIVAGKKPLSSQVK